MTEQEFDGRIEADKSNIADIIEDRIKFNRWTAFFMLILAALITVLYINNVLTVDRYLVEIRKYEAERKLLSENNESLNARLIELQSPERINKIATEKLNMVLPDKAPELLEE